MQTYTIRLDPAAARLYRAVAVRAGLPVEQILADALFRLAGELALESLSGKKNRSADETIDFR